MQINKLKPNLKHNLNYLLTLPLHTQVRCQVILNRVHPLSSWSANKNSYPKLVYIIFLGCAKWFSGIGPAPTLDHHTKSERK